MELFSKMFSLQIELLLLMSVGFILSKCHIIDKHQQKGLSELLINVVLPANIIKSFLSCEFNSKLANNCLLMIVICAVIQVFTIVICPLLFKESEKSKECVMEYGMIVSNSSFVGIPVVDYLFGDVAVMYTAIFQIPMRITMWTAGISLFTTQYDKKEKLKLIFAHPCIIAVYVGIVLMLLPIELPSFISGTIGYLSSATTCLSMIIIGAILSQIDLKNILDKESIYFSFLRLIAFPLLVLIVLKLVKVDDMLVTISVLLTAMPCGSTCAILAQKYNQDELFASKIIFVSSLLSTITIPMLCLFL